jgi:hypothetical protein
MVIARPVRPSSPSSLLWLAAPLIALYSTCAVMAAQLSRISQP